jgi:hypothetical protein
VVSSGYDLDPGFRAAVDEGRLSIEEAVRRGNRTVYAAELRRRHQLSEAAALDVSDNRITLSQALRQLEEQAAVAAAAEPYVPPTASTGQKVALMTLAATVVTVIAWNTWSTSHGAIPPPAPPRAVAPSTVEAPAAIEAPQRVEQRLLAATKVRTAPDGTPFEISGPDPRSVLLAYCQAMAPERKLEPLGITQTDSRSRNVRLGNFRDLHALQQDFSIRIRKDWKTRRWVTGAGMRQIPVSARVRPADDEEVEIASSR